MKKFNCLVVCLVAFVSVGCASPTYNTVKTGADRYTLTGPDPNQLQGNAYKACRDDGFDDYSVVETTKNRIDVRCEKHPKSFFSSVSEKGEKAWNYVKNKVDAYRQSPASNDQATNK